MVLDIYAYAFYGVSISSDTLRMLERRDDKRGRKCPMCGVRLESNFCPDDGAKSEIIKAHPGLKELQRFSDRGIKEVPIDDICKDIRYGVAWMGADTGHYLYEKYSRVMTESNRRGFELRAIGKRIYESIDFEVVDIVFGKVCEYLKIPFTEPQFYVGLHWKDDE